MSYNGFAVYNNQNWISCKFVVILRVRSVLMKKLALKVHAELKFSSTPESIITAGRPYALNFELKLIKLTIV